MSLSRMTSWLVTLVAAALLAGQAWGADFTQAERDVEFIKASRRQDASLRAHFGNLITPDTQFFHLGGFKALIHRDGLDRPLWLVPVKSVPVSSAGELRDLARGNPRAVGILTVAYANQDPHVTPGSFVLLFDGLRVRLVDVREYIVNKIEVTLEEAPADGELDVNLGTVTGTAYGQANISPAGDLEIYLQLEDEDGKPLMDEGGFCKLLMTIPIAGLASDDDSPYRELAVPEEEED